MGYKNKKRRRAYQLVWLNARRDSWIQDNGPCVCGSWDRLEVDHIDPSTKLMNPRELWSRRQEVRDAELAKCQVLCYECHKKKSRAESLQTNHGNYVMYTNKKCRCDECRAWKKSVNAQRKERGWV